MYISGLPWSTNTRMAIALGRYSTVVVTEDGDIFSCGDNSRGQLGLGHYVGQQKPVLVNDTENVFKGEDAVMVAAGRVHAACVTSDGCAWIWGNECASTHTADNGFQTTANALRPRLIYTPAGVGRTAAVMMACGHNFSLLLTETGEVWGMGDDENGCLGRGPDDDVTNKSIMARINPVYLGGVDSERRPLVHIGMIGVGDYHSLAVESNGGRLWTWGRNSAGQLGHGNHGCTTNRYLPTEINKHTFDVTTGQTVTADPVVFVDGSAATTMVVTASGAVWGCGDNQTGELGLGERRRYDTMQRVAGHETLGAGGARTVSCGPKHALVVTHTNNVWSCGRGIDPLLGTGMHQQDSLVLTPLNREDFDDADVAIAVAGSTHSAAVTTSGRMYSWGLSSPHRVHNGMGLDCTQNQWTPCAIASCEMRRERVGRWHATRDATIIAFLLGQHNRLGILASNRGLCEGTLTIILENLRFKCREGTSKGLARLMGFSAS